MRLSEARHAVCGDVPKAGCPCAALRIRVGDHAVAKCLRQQGGGGVVRFVGTPGMGVLHIAGCL